MTQTHDSGSSKTPSFGAFIETAPAGSSSSETSPQTAKGQKAEKAEKAEKRSEVSDDSGGKRRRGSRGGRGRGSSDKGSSEKGPSEKGPSQKGRAQDEVAHSGAASDASGESAGPESSQDDSQPRKKRSRRGRRGRRGGRSSDEEGERSADENEADEAEERAAAPARKKRSRRSRSRRSQEAREEDGEGRDAEARDASSPPRAQDDEEEGGEPQKRRRRGSRGGRKRSRRASSDERSDDGSERPAAAVVEVIPGESDDLPELPDLPDDAEEISSEEGGSKKRKRSRRKKSGSSREGAKQRSKRGAQAGEDDDVVEDDDDFEEAPTRAKRGSKKQDVVPDHQILVNAADSEETRVAVVKDQRILDFQMNVESDKSLVNDIYRGRVVNLEESIGAAFIDFGRGRNGFLHTSDVLPAYGEKGWDLTKLLSTRIDAEEWDENSSQPHIADELDVADDEDDDGEDGDAGSGGKGRSAKGGKKSSGRGKQAQGNRRRARPRKPIKDMLRVGDRVVVQVTKDAIGDKGPTLTTYISIPGRYHVLMPSTDHRGVSRKIEDARERRRLKKILDSLEIPDGMGVIARTAAKGCTKVELKRDLDYLLDAWQRLSKRITSGHGPVALYQESDVAIRTVRDLFGPETEAVIVDEPETYERVKEFAELLMPEHIERIKLHEGDRPLFHSAGIEQEFERIFSRRIELPSGGSIVFDQAEALVAIDVNSGKTRTSSHDFEEIAVKTNMDAVPEIARQIRLRDMGGILVVDFIDMMKNANRRAVEKAFRTELAEDRARSKVGRISQFGLLEMTRQRLGPGMSKKLFMNCPACRGQGRVRTAASRAAGILRRLGSAMTLKGFSTVEVRAHPDAIAFLKKEHRSDLAEIEKKNNRKLTLTEVPDQIEDSVLRYLRADGREVRPGGRRKR